MLGGLGGRRRRGRQRMRWLDGITDSMDVESGWNLGRNAKLTIFDEPEAGIDIWSFNNLIKVFENMRKVVKGTILIISHQERILNIADEIILLNNGKIEKMGKKEEIMGDILKQETAGFCAKLGGENNE